MTPAFSAAFVAMTRSFEGDTNFMYLDVLGYVTTGFGNMIDTPRAALALPWKRPGGELATRDEVVSAWSVVRNRQDMRKAGGGHFASLTTLRLDADGVATLVARTIASNDVSLHRRYRDFADWPACARMACHGLAWACGTGYRFPAMDTALVAGDFLTAAEEIELTKASNPGNDLRKRNEAHRILMRNADHVRAFHLDPELVDWTHDLAIVSAAETEPDLPNPPSEPTIHVMPDMLDAWRRRDEGGS